MKLVHWPLTGGGAVLHPSYDSTSIEYSEPVKTGHVIDGVQCSEQQKQTKGANKQTQQPKQQSKAKPCVSMQKKTEKNKHARVQLYYSVSFAFI